MKLTYGLNAQERLVHISEVERGDACACLCPACKSPLRAKKGEVVLHHFAHVNAECERAVESALHLAAKEVLAEVGAIWLPSLTATIKKDLRRLSDGALIPGFGKEQIFQAQVIPLSNVRLEQRLGAITPDLVANHRGTDLLIEIAVTHFINEEKLAKIEEIGIATVEIDLSKLDRIPDRKELAALLTQENPFVTWVYSPKRKQVESA